MVLACNVEKIVGRIGPSPGVALAIAPADGPVGVSIAVLDLTGQSLVKELGMLHANIALQGKTLDGHDVDIGIAEYAPRVVRIVATVIQCLHRVVNIRAQHGLCIAKDARFAVDGQDRMLTHGTVRNATVAIGVGATVFPIGHHQVLAHAHIFIKIVGRVDTGCDAAIESLVHQTVLVDIVAREEIRAFV